MTDLETRALLPAGLRDSLPPDAAHEAATVDRLLAAFTANGYELVNPPLVEFEESFLSGGGSGLAPDTFRLMDPISQRMMAVRSDMTVQVARIATTRLAASQRPLRIAYAGPVLRVMGTQLRPARQFCQAGLELIGSDAVAADAEIVLLAVDALAGVGIRDLTVDLNLPTLVPAVCTALGFEGEVLSRLKVALDRKDAAEVREVAGTATPALAALLAASGEADAAIRRLAKLRLPPAAGEVVERLAEIARLVRAELPGVRLTVDAVEHRGFEYHTGTAFSLFSDRVRGELGRGGRYRAGNGTEGGEPATGATLYLDMVLQAAGPAAARQRLYLPAGTAAAVRRAAQEAGYATVAGLEPVAETPDALRTEARRLGCDAMLADGAIRPVED